MEQENCECCHIDGSGCGALLNHSNSGFRVSLDEDYDLYVDFEIDAGCVPFDYMKINYCPMCGRKLEEN